MPSYILSNANRFYVALEQAYGQVAAISKDSRFQALRLQAHQILEQTKRLDKTGTRSFFGRSATPRRRTAYELSTIITSWSSLENFSLGAFFQAGLGAIPTVSQSATVAAQIDPVHIQTVSPHGL